MLKIDGSVLEYDFNNRNTISPEIRGKTCFILKSGEIVDKAREYFGRPGAVLKIFLTPLIGDIEDYMWGTRWRIYSKERTEEIGRISKLVEASKIQNICSIANLAPRVYGILLIEKNGQEFPAQLVEEIGGDFADNPTELLEKIEKHLTEMRILTCHKELPSSKDFIDGKLIDFQGFRFTPNTHAAIREYIVKYGQYGRGHYQSVPELGLSAQPRDTLRRIKEMHLDEINFEGKDVLDIGCSLGVFSCYAAKNGARRVIGIDNQKTVIAASTLAYYLGYLNNDYFAMDLKEDSLPYTFDITFFLSMNVHIGFPDWIMEQTKETLIFEENAKKSQFETQKWLDYFSNYFKDVKVVGRTNDQNPEFYKPIIHCYNKK